MYYIVYNVYYFANIYQNLLWNNEIIIFFSWKRAGLILFPDKSIGNSKGWRLSELQNHKI